MICPRDMHGAEFERCQVVNRDSSSMIIGLKALPHCLFILPAASIRRGMKKECSAPPPGIHMSTNAALTFLLLYSHTGSYPFLII